MYKLCDNPHDENSCNRFLSKPAPKCDLIQAYANASIPVPINTPIPFTNTNYMSCISSIKLDNNIFQTAECGLYMINYCVQVETTDESRAAALAAKYAAIAAADARIALEAAKAALDAQEQAKEATIAVGNLATDAAYAAAYALGTAIIVAGRTQTSTPSDDTPDNRRLALEAADEADIAAAALEAAIAVAAVKIPAATSATEAAETAANNALASAETAKDNATPETQGLAETAYTDATYVANLADAAVTAAGAAQAKEEYILEEADPSVTPPIFSAKYTVEETRKVAQYTRDVVTALENNNPTDANTAVDNAVASAKAANQGYLAAYLKAVFNAALAIQTAISAAIAVITAAEIAVASAIASATAAEVLAQSLAPAVVLRLKVPPCAHISPCGDCPPIDASPEGWTTLDCSRRSFVSAQQYGSISGTYQLEIMHPCAQIELINDIKDTDNNTLTLNPARLPNTYINIFRVCDGCCKNMTE